MNEATLPPSPNWYLSSILSCSFDGTIAWGARNEVIICKLGENDKILKYSVIKNAHKDRVTSVIFIPEFEQLSSQFLASIGDDDTIKIWNTDTLSEAYTYSLSNGRQATAIAWSYKEPLLIYFTSSDGYVLLWNAPFDTVSTISLGKVTATCLSSCPHNPNLVAIGSKSGLVYIVSFHRNGKVLYKLRGHDTEIVDLSWCPSEKNVISGNQNRDLLLASGSKDRSIFIWRAGGDGRYEMEIALPISPLDSHRHRGKLNASVGNWIAVCWIEPKLLLASSSWGELVSCDLSSMTKNKPTWKLIHSCHARGLFCIANVPKVEKDLIDDWRKKSSLTIWTLAQDRQVVCCSIKETNIKIEYNIPTQGGYVYCIAACPLDTSCLAFGVGDAMLRLWNLSEAHDTSFNITTLWQKIKGQIRAVSWHPEKENLVAFATGEGRVGVFNTNGSQLPTLYRQYHRNTVYTLGWGPIPDNERYVLYSCAEGELVYYDPDKVIEDPTPVLKQHCTEFAWKPDLACLAVGFENGSISILNRRLVKCGYVNVNSKCVQCLVWHPESTASDLTFSPLRHYLAAAFNSSKITIFDLSSIIDSLNMPENTAENETVNQKYKIVATLYGHVDKVVCLAWSPHLSGYLVSGSYDNTAQVWNVETQELIGTYNGHYAPVLCCLWSPLHPDYIITGSADFSMRIWNITNNSAVMPSEKDSKRKSSKKNKKKQNKTNKVGNGLNRSELSDLCNAASELSILNAPVATKQIKPATIKEPKKKKCERTSYFAKSNKTLDDKTILLNAIKDIVEKMKSTGNSEEDEKSVSCSTALSLFSEKEDFLLLLSNEKSVHAAEERYNTVTEMDMWCNDLKQNLETAAKEKRLNDFLVSLAPSLSIKTWKEMCEVYANQLIAEGNPYKGVSYLLSIHKNYEAVEVFEEAHLYKEAYALAKCKLDSDDPVLKDILKNWADYCAKTGQFEQAAYIYAKLKDFFNAVKYLARRKDAATLMIAAEVAATSADEGLSKSLAEQALTLALINTEYDLAETIINKFSYLKYREIHLLVLKELQKMISRHVELDSIQTWLDGNSDCGLLQNLENVCHNYSAYYSELLENNSYNSYEDEGALWVAVSYEIAMAVTCNTAEQKLMHIVAILDTITQFELLNRQTLKNQCCILIIVIIKLDAKSPLKDESIYAKTNYPVSKSLRAYLCFSLLTWIADHVKRAVIDESLEIIVDFIENSLEEVINQEAIKQWTLRSEIIKLETQLTSLSCDTQEEGKTEDEQSKTSIIEKLNALKMEKKQFTTERVCVPNPLNAYCKANELASRLVNETIKTKFLETVSRSWMAATS